MFFNQLSKVVKTYRKEHNLSQAELAEKLNISVNYLGAIERGDRTPGLDTLIRIANELKVSTDILLSDVTYIGIERQKYELMERINRLSPRNRAMVLEILNTLLNNLE